VAALICQWKAMRIAIAIKTPEITMARPTRIVAAPSFSATIPLWLPHSMSHARIYEIAVVQKIPRLPLPFFKVCGIERQLQIWMLVFLWACPF
jgi:hypothetical protein